MEARGFGGVWCLVLVLVLVMVFEDCLSIGRSLTSAVDRLFLSC